MKTKTLIDLRFGFMSAAIASSLIGVIILLLLVFAFAPERQPGVPILESWLFKRARSLVTWPIVFGSIAGIAHIMIRWREASGGKGDDAEPLAKE